MHKIFSLSRLQDELQPLNHELEILQSADAPEQRDRRNYALAMHFWGMQWDYSARHVKLLVLGSSSYSIGLVNDHAHNRLAYCSAANERMRIANLKLQFSENNIGNWFSLWSNYKALQFKEYLQFHSSVCAWWTSWNFLFPHIYSKARELFSLSN